MRRSLLAGPIPSLVGVGIVILLAIAVSLDLTDALDRSIIDVVRSDALAGLLSPLRWITELGSSAAVTGVAVATVIVALAIGPWRHGVAGAMTIGLASLGNQAFKAFVARARPDLLEPVIVERGFSFPSGHAALSMVAYGVLGVILARSIRPGRVQRALIITLGLTIFLVGLSRVWLGVHYPSDVVAGWTAGAVIVLVFARLTRSVSLEPISEAVDGDRAAPRSDPPGLG